MSAGYSGTPLVKKLGFKPGFRYSLLHAPPELPSLLAPLPDGVVGSAPLPGTLKVCAVSDIWSGLKFVIRVKDRPKA